MSRLYLHEVKCASRFNLLCVPFFPTTRGSFKKACLGICVTRTPSLPVTAKSGPCNDYTLEFAKKKGLHCVHMQPVEKKGWCYCYYALIVTVCVVLLPTYLVPPPFAIFKSVALAFLKGTHLFPGYTFRLK